MNNNNYTKKRVAIVVDNPFRDLSGLILTAWRLCREGVTSFLVPASFLNREIGAIGPDMILLNYFRSVYESHIQSFLDAGISLGVLDTEGAVFSPMPPGTIEGKEHVAGQNGLSPAFEEYAVGLSKREDLRRQLSRLCAWSHPFAQYAEKSGWYNGEQISVTGTPRTDFLSPMWSDVSLNMSPYCDQYPKPIVLIASNFALANTGCRSPLNEMKALRDKYNYSEKFVNHWYETEKKSIDGLVSLTQALGKAFPNVTFIYRPHPFESIEHYAPHFAPYPNVHLVRKGTIEGWLLRSKAVIVLGSSTAVDAGLAGIPALVPAWLPVHLPIPAVDATGNRCENEANLIKTIEDIMAGTYQTPENVAQNLKSVEEEIYFKIDGLAHQRVSNVIRDILGNNGRHPDLDKTRKLFETHRRTPSMVGSLPWQGSQKYFDAETVARVVAEIEKSEKKQRNHKTNKVHKVNVLPALENGAYMFSPEAGCSVVLSPGQPIEPGTE